MTNTPLTSDELAWIKDNPEAVRVLMAKKMESPSEEKTAKSDPVSEIADYLIKSMHDIIGQIETKMGRRQNEFMRYQSMIDNPNSNDDTLAFAAEIIEREGPESEAKIATYKQHIKAIRKKIETLKSKPTELLLPFGTIVKFVGVPDYANSKAIMDDRKSYPVAGTIGVVTQLNRDGEYPLGVSVRDNYRNGWGQSYTVDYDRFTTFRADIGMFEVIGYALLPNGEEYQDYGFHQTHIGSLTTDDEHRKEMILEANGYFWRFHDFGGTQSIESLQAFESMDEMSWIEGLADEYKNTALAQTATLPTP